MSGLMRSTWGLFSGKSSVDCDIHKKKGYKTTDKLIDQMKVCVSRKVDQLKVKQALFND